MKNYLYLKIEKLKTASLVLSRSKESEIRIVCLFKRRTMNECFFLIEDYSNEKAILIVCKTLWKFLSSVSIRLSKLCRFSNTCLFVAISLQLRFAFLNPLFSNSRYFWRHNSTDMANNIEQIVFDILCYFGSIYKSEVFFFLLWKLLVIPCLIKRPF